LSYRLLGTAEDDIDRILLVECFDHLHAVLGRKLGAPLPLGIQS